MREILLDVQPGFTHHASRITFDREGRGEGQKMKRWIWVLPDYHGDSRRMRFYF